MSIYYVHLDVKFKRPLKIVHEKPKRTRQNNISGFLQEIGCTANSEEVMRTRVIDQALSADEKLNAEAHFEYIGVIEPDSLNQEIYEDKDIADALKQDPRCEGIWYASGRGYYK